MVSNIQSQTTADNVYVNFLIRDQVRRFVDPNIERVDVHELQMHKALHGSVQNDGDFQYGMQN